MKNIVVFLIFLFLFSCDHQHRNIGRITGKLQSPDRENILTCHAIHGSFSSNTLGYVLKINATPYLEFPYECNIFGKWESNEKIVIVSDSIADRIITKSEKIEIQIIIDKTLNYIKDSSFVRM